MDRRSPWGGLAMLAMLLAGCASLPGGPPLVGTQWRLIHFTSPEDSIGVIRAQPNEIYTLRLEPNGTLTAKLFCNQGSGRWGSPDAARAMGRIMLDLKAVTAAACIPSALERVGSDLARVRSFVIRDGRLHLNLMVDGGDYVWVAD